MPVNAKDVTDAHPSKAGDSADTTVFIPIGRDMDLTDVHPANEDSETAALPLRTREVRPVHPSKA